MSKIKKVYAREILDSRGFPTIKTEILTEKNGYGSFSVPSGLSTGKNEAFELRDENKNRFFGKGMLKAVDIINNKIAPLIIGIEVTKQNKIDNLMIALDGTETKKKLGANSILSVSIAVAKAASDELKIPLYRYLGGVNTKNIPLPMFNIINGGKHSSGIIDFQEFMIVPVGAKNFKESLRWCSEIFYILKNILYNKNESTELGDEGGFSPRFLWFYKNKYNFKNFKFKTPIEVALDLILESINKSGYKIGPEGIMIAIDCAASELYNYNDNKYHFKKIENLFNINYSFSSEEMIIYLKKLVDNYPIISIEDGMSELDFFGFLNLFKKLGNKIQIVGDDLFATNTKLTLKGIKNNIANSIIIKLNQIGTLTETIDTVELAKKFGWTTIISHRSGETEDTFISDLSVALNSSQIKAGSISRMERVAKYNRLLIIEEELSKISKFNGIKSFYNLKKFYF